VVDIDENELRKHTLNIDIPILADALAFINAFIETGLELPNYEPWLDQCRIYRDKYPTILPARKTPSSFIDSYVFFDTLSECARDTTVFVLGNGTACVSAYQSLRLKSKQRVVVNSGCAAMGYAIPASIGAFFGTESNCPVICITGDGSMQLNIQELQTIIHYRIPIKLFILNNDGYVSIRNTQNNFFNGHLVGSNRQSGISCPDTVAIAQAYGFVTKRIYGGEDLASELLSILESEGSTICEVMLSPNEKVEPKLSSEIRPDGKIVSKPLEDMSPLLDREEFRSNMLVPTINE
jgi:acetolactate synthase-1/2/3 large subunit